MTIRPTFYALAALMLLILVTGAFWAGGRDNAAREADRRIETLETVNELEREARDETDDDLSRSISEP